MSLANLTLFVQAHLIVLNAFWQKISLYLTSVSPLGKEFVKKSLLQSLYYHPQSTNNRIIQKGVPNRKGIEAWKVEHAAFLPCKETGLFRYGLLFICAETIELCKLCYLGIILCMHTVSYSISCMHKWQSWETA